MIPPAVHRVGKYELIEPLGEGGMGQVWRARDETLRRVVALKLVSSRSPEALRRFRREAEVTARLSHPNIAALYEVSDDPRDPYIALQLVDGVRVDHPSIEMRARIEALRDAARAVHYAHGQGILHRDLKPGNLMVGRDGRAFVLDFGLARPVEKGPDETVGTLSATGDVLGTPAFMSPEQARGEVHRLDARTDVYGLGATLYALVTGKPPFSGGGALEILKRVEGEDPVPPRRVNPVVAPEIEAIAQVAMEKDPARRYATAADVADDLDRFLRGDPVRARAASLVERIVRRVRRQPILWGLAAALAVSVAAGVAFGGTWLVQRNLALEEQLRLSDEARVRAESLGRIEGARRRVEEVERVLYMAHGSLAPYTADLAEAERECRTTLETMGGNWSPAWRWIGRARLLAADFAGAVDALQHSAEGEDLDPYARYDLARARLALAHQRWIDASEPTERRFAFLEEALRQAAATLETLPEGPPEGIDADILSAYRAWTAGDHDRIRSILASWQGRPAQPGVEVLFYIAGEMAESREEAEACYAYAIEMRPGYYEARLALSDLCFQAGRFDEAEAHATEAIRILPAWPYPYNNRGLARTHLRKYADARADFDEAERLAPRLFPVFVNRAYLSVEEGRFDVAEADLERARAIHPDNATYFLNLAYLRRRQGRPEEAERAYSEAIRVEPDWAALYGQRGRARLDQGRDREALEDLDRALAANPRDAELLMGRVLAHFRLGELEKAEIDATAALEVAPEAPNFYARAVLRERLGDLDGALSDYRDALRTAPAGWADASAVRARIRALENRE